ncbi:hypothetical protein [Sciscionella marina]|uniref:hypothetical protein n=1 Tax=Sciscionella marina TaxID=508770 RepID=UPI000360B28F|nr:hypothetical protein [Sciscionella marina]
MGLGQWFADRAHDVGKAIDSTVDAVVDGAGDVLNGIGNMASDTWAAATGNVKSPPGGATDPKKIYEGFYESRGPGSYQTAQAVLGEAAPAYGDVSKAINIAKNTLNSGFKGAAGDKARAALGKVSVRFDKMSAGASDASKGVQGQLDTWSNTKPKVQKVPSRSEMVGSVSNPVTMIGNEFSNEDSINAQTQKSIGNAQAYSGYGSASGPQGTGLPRTTLDTAPPPDTNVGSHDVGSGIQMPATNQFTSGHSGSTGPQTFNAGNTSPNHTPPPSNPGGTTTAGVSGPPSPGPVNVPPPSTGGGPVSGPGGPLGPGPIGGADPRLPGGGEPFSPSTGGGGAVRSGGGVPPFAPVTDGGSGDGSTVRGRPRPGTFRGGSLKEPESGSGSSGKGSGMNERTQPGGRTAAKALGAEPEGAAAGKAAAAAGKSSSGAVPPGGAGRKGEKDKEHETASYLINEEHGSEIVGEMPMTAPPVIGDTNPATEQ